MKGIFHAEGPLDMAGPGKEPVIVDYGYYAEDRLSSYAPEFEFCQLEESVEAGDIYRVTLRPLGNGEVGVKLENGEEEITAQVGMHLSRSRSRPGTVKLEPGEPVLPREIDGEALNAKDRAIEMYAEFALEQGDMCQKVLDPGNLEM